MLANCLGTHLKMLSWKSEHLIKNRILMCTSQFFSPYPSFLAGIQQEKLANNEPECVAKMTAVIYLCDAHHALHPCGASQNMWMRWNHLIAQYLIAVGFFTDEASFPSNSSHLLLYSEPSPVKYIQNKRALTALNRSQQCTYKGLFYPRADEKASKMQYVSSNIWHQGRQKMNWHNNKLLCS